ncbi:MAG: hypothetical protein CMJ40_00400 [Phycisphaerae bacterium]|nr:hypothetical protein [Phycisphaerae bacterium]
MINQIPRISISLLSFSILLASSSLLSGCGSEEEPVKEVKKVAPKKAAPVVKLMTIDELMAEMEIDDRIYVPEEEAPVTNQARRGVLTFFDSWVTGDHETVMGMLGAADGAELKAMVEDGQWASATGDRIDAVYVTTGSSAEGGRCVLAIYEVGAISQPQLWNYREEGEGVRFESVATPPEMMGRLSGEDLIAAWWDILAKEQLAWDVPDTDLSDLIIEDNDETLASGPGSGGSKKRSPGGGGSKKRSPGGR